MNMVWHTTLARARASAVGSARHGAPSTPTRGCSQHTSPTQSPITKSQNSSASTEPTLSERSLNDVAVLGTARAFTIEATEPILRNSFDVRTTASSPRRPVTATTRAGGARRRRFPKLRRAALYVGRCARRAAPKCLRRRRSGELATSNVCDLHVESDSQVKCDLQTRSSQSNDLTSNSVTDSKNEKQLGQIVISLDHDNTDRGKTSCAVPPSLQPRRMKFSDDHNADESTHLAPLPVLHMNPQTQDDSKVAAERIPLPPLSVSETILQPQYASEDASQHASKDASTNASKDASQDTSKGASKNGLQDAPTTRVEKVLLPPLTLSQSVDPLPADPRAAPAAPAASKPKRDFDRYEEVESDQVKVYFIDARKRKELDAAGVGAAPKDDLLAIKIFKQSATGHQLIKFLRANFDADYVWLFARYAVLKTDVKDRRQLQMEDTVGDMAAIVDSNRLEMTCGDGRYSTAVRVKTALSVVDKTFYQYDMDTPYLYTIAVQLPNVGHAVVLLRVCDAKTTKPIKWVALDLRQTFYVPLVNCKAVDFPRGGCFMHQTTTPMTLRDVAHISADYATGTFHKFRRNCAIWAFEFCRDGLGLIEFTDRWDFVSRCLVDHPANDAQKRKEPTEVRHPGVAHWTCPGGSLLGVDLAIPPRALIAAYACNRSRPQAFDVVFNNKGEVIRALTKPEFWDSGV